MNPPNDDFQESPHPEIPSAPASEVAYLGAVLRQQIDTFFLEPQEFRQQRHELIYTRAVRRQMNDEPFDLALLTQELGAAGELAIIGGAGYLEMLAAQGEISPAVIDEHARQIRAKSTAYELQKLGAALMESAALDPEKALARYRATVENLESRLHVGAKPRYSTAADLDALLGSIEWLWPNWILRGFVTCLVAQQGQGKSFLALDLCARILQGTEWPDREPLHVPGFDDKTPLLWIDTEMAIAALSERLSAFGLDKTRFILPEDPLRQLKLDNEADWRWIETVVAHKRPPLVVIDSLSGGHSAEEKDNGEMKTIMLRLSKLAQDYKIAIIVVHHIRKAAPGEMPGVVTIDQVRGASAITQLARSVVSVCTPDKTQPLLRRADVIKSNFAKHPEPLGFEILGNALAWGDAPETPTGAKPIDEARAFLLEALRDSRRLSSDIQEEAQQLGIVGRTLTRAKDDLKIKAIKEQGRDGRWFWDLPNRPANYPIGKVEG